MSVDLLSPASNTLYLRLFFLLNEIISRCWWARCLFTRLTHPQPVTKHLTQGTMQSLYTSICMHVCVCVCVCMRAWTTVACKTTIVYFHMGDQSTSEPTKQANDCVHCEHCTFYCCASNKLKAFPRDLLTAHARTHQPRSESLCTGLALSLCGCVCTCVCL